MAKQRNFPKVFFPDGTTEWCHYVSNSDRVDQYHVCHQSALVPTLPRYRYVERTFILSALLILLKK